MEDSNLEGFLGNFMKPKEVNMDGATDWGPPSLQGQFEQADLWEQDGWSVRVFDLSKSEELEEYQALLTASSKKDPEHVIVEQEKQFCDSVNNWKIFVTSVKIKYRNLAKNDEK